MKEYVVKIPRESGLYETLHKMLILASSIYISSSYLINRNPIFKNDDTLGLDDINCEWTIRIPSFLPMFYALQKKQPNSIEIKVTPYEPFNSQHYNAGKMFNVVNLVFMPMFINYFEQHKEQVVNAWGGSPSKWQGNSWQVGSVVRNAFSHDGKIEIRSDSFSVNWNGRAITKINSGEELMGNYCSVGNILDLLLHMEDERSDLTPSIHTK